MFIAHIKDSTSTNQSMKLNQVTNAPASEKSYYMWVFPKIVVVFAPNHHPLNNRGFPLFSPSILEVFPLFLETPIYSPDIKKMEPQNTPPPPLVTKGETSTQTTNFMGSMLVVGGVFDLSLEVRNMTGFRRTVRS